jgi:hypothetical protein
MKGSYVLTVDYSYYAHKAMDFSGRLVVLTGYIRADAGDDCSIKVYRSASSARVGSPSKYVYIALDFTKDGIEYNEWIPFYIIADTAGWTGSYFHVEFFADSTAGSIFIDDLRVYVANEIIQMECPQSLKQVWRRYTDAEYELINGEKKAFIKGWRPVYSLGYEYCSKAELIKNIGISESTFTLFVPQSDNMNFAYVRMVNDFDSSYFHNKFIGHAQDLELEGIFLQRYKNKQWGYGYFSVLAA